MTRRAISKRVRFEVFKRDQFTCQYCGAHPPGVILHVDHIDPVANGGGNDADNLTTACESCNLGKGAVTLSAVPESLATKASRVAEAEEQLRGYQEVMRAKADRLEEEKWQVAEILWPGSSESGANRSDLLSIKKFIEQLGLYVVLDAAEVAKAWRPWGGKRMFLYFCGVCWKKIRGE
jgi:hypothetical protein